MLSALAVVVHQIGRAEDVAAQIGGQKAAGVFVGLDERGGMLLRDGDETRLIPLTAMLEG